MSEKREVPEVSDDGTDIRYDERDGTAWITIHRPAVANAFRTRTLLELVEALWKADVAPVASVVLTGTGEKAFCSGGDVAEMRALDATSGRLFLKRFTDVVRTIRGLRKPVVARVDGYCLGGGNEISVACDLTVASDRSTFGQVGPTVGSVPVIGATQLLPRIVGEKRAGEMIFLCRRYSAREACEMGLVNRVVAASELDAAVREWTARMAELSPQALRIAKVSLNHAGDELEPSISHGVEMLTAAYGTEEFQEGMTSFLEKRKPDFARFR